MYYESSGNLVNPMAASVTDRMFIRMMILYIPAPLWSSGHNTRLRSRITLICTFDSVSAQIFNIMMGCIKYSQRHLAYFLISFSTHAAQVLSDLTAEDMGEKGNSLRK